LTADAYLWIIPAQNVYCNIFVSNSYIPDMIVGAKGAFGSVSQSPVSTAITLHAERNFSAGHGSIFPAGDGRQLPNAHHLDIHMGCSPGMTFQALITFFLSYALILRADPGSCSVR
jgi:hypothetical protein